MGCITSKEEDKKDLSVTDENRWCTDVLFLILYILSFLLFVGMGIAGFKLGNPYRVVYGSDYNGDVCGEEGRGKYTYYPRLSQDIGSALSSGGLTDPAKLNPANIHFYGICMSACPMENEVVCNYDYPSVPTSASFEASCGTKVGQMTNSVCNQCWISPLNTTVILYRCIWTEAKVTVSTTSCAFPADANVNSADCTTKVTSATTTTFSPAQSNTIIDEFATVAGTLTTMVGDLYNGRVVIFVVGIVGAVAIGFIWLVMVQCCASVVVWITMWGSVLLCFAITIFCFFQGGVFNIQAIENGINALQAKANTSYNFGSAFNKLNSTVLKFESAVPASLQTDNATTMKYWIYAGWVWLILSIILLTIVVGFAQKIKIAIEILRESAQAVKEVWLIVFFPIFTMALTVGLFVWFVFSCACIKTMGSGVTLGSLVPKNKYTANITTNFKVFSENNVAQPLLWTNLALFLWNLNVIQGIGMMTIAGVIGTWYFTRPDGGPGTAKNIPLSTITTSFKRVWRYHLGTIAFGALLVTIVQMARAAMAYIDQRTKSMQQSNVSMKVLMKVVQCCLFCFDKCLKFITNNAYIVTALRGKSFIPATCRAFRLILSQALTLAVLTLVTSFVMVVGKLFMTGVCVTIAYGYLSYYPSNFDIHNKTVVLAMVGLTSYTISRSFLQVYSMSIDTLMICYAEDVEVNSADMAKCYMGPRFRKVLQIKGSAAKVDDEKADEATDLIIKTPDVDRKSEKERVATKEAEL